MAEDECEMGTSMRLALLISLVLGLAVLIG